MIIETQARNARRLDEGIWLAELTPLELQFLDPQDESDADVSVVLCSEPPEFDPEARTLRLRWGSAKAVVIARTERLVVVCTGREAS